MHSFNSRKQSIQAWNSVAYCSLCAYLKNLKNIHPSIIPWCCQQTRTQKLEKWLLYPRGSTNHPPNFWDCSLCHSRIHRKFLYKYSQRFFHIEHEVWCIFCPLHWRHNGRDRVSNHQPHDCLLNRLFRRRSKKTSKLRVTGLCVGNSPGTGEFPAHMASYAENVSIWWRHHAD